MSKLFLGNRLADLDIGEPSLPVSKVILNVDSETYYQSGDDTGATVEANCPWATQEMADNVLAQIKGFVYKPFSGYDALLDPSAELGDAITVGGHYGVLAQMGRSLDRQSSATVGAPGIDEIEDEYPYKTKQRKATDRVLAKSYARISKTAKEIRQEIVNEVEGLSASFTVELDRISAEIVGVENSVSELELSLENFGVRIQDVEGNIAELELTTQGFGVSIEGLEDDYAELALTLDGLTVTDSSGTTRIKGSSVETDTLYVNAANILGTLTAEQIVLTGSITWNDLSEGVQSTINGAYGGDVPDYIKSTYIDSVKIMSPEIYAGTFYGTEFNVISDGSEGSLKLNALFDGAQQTFFQIDFYEEASLGVPHVNLGCPYQHGAVMDFGDGMTDINYKADYHYFEGYYVGISASNVIFSNNTVDFSTATVTGFTAVWG